MIEFDRVTYTFPEASRPALREVSFRLPPGQLALLAGPSGSGKSTLLRCLNGLTPHFSGGALSGRVRVAGLDPVIAAPQGMSRAVGFVFQEPEAQFIVDRVEDEIAFALENAAFPPESMRQRVAETLERLRLTPLRRRRIETLSGGERQRVALACVLALGPRVLALDEPTSQLDADSAEDVLQTVARLKQEMGLTVLIAEHRLERVLPFADRLLRLEAGQLTLSAEPRAALRAFEPRPPLAALAHTLHWPEMPLTVAEARGQAARCGSVLPPAPPPAAPPTGPAVLSARGLSVSLGGAPVLAQVDLDLRAGEILAVMGPNGAGKTTLLRCLVGLQRPSSGRVLLEGRDIAGQPAAEICRRAAYLPQASNRLLYADTVFEELNITLRNHGLTRPPDQLLALLDELGISGYAQTYPRDLSAGERQRAALAALLAAEPPALLLDEPTRGLDYHARQRLAHLLLRWKDQGKAILLVTHDPEFAALTAARALRLQAGRVTAHGPLAEALPWPTQTAQVFPGSGWLTPPPAA